jgi:hypothetical protein
MAIAHFPATRSSGGVARAQAILHIGYVLLPAIAGADKFMYALADWTKYLAPQFPQMLGVSPQLFMQGVGIVEVVAALLVLMSPRIGGIVVALWLWGIIVNLVMLGGYYDIALRDFGLSLGALALASLAAADRRRLHETAR